MANSKRTAMRKLSITDGNTQLELTLWHDFTDQDIEVGDILKLRNVRVGDLFRGVGQLGSTSTTIIEVIYIYYIQVYIL